MYAGLQGGDVCSCGNSYGSYGLASVPCNMNCTGDYAGNCGNVNANAIYRTMIGMSATAPFLLIFLLIFYFVD